MADPHDYGWIGSVASGIGVALGAAAAVFVGAWKMLSIFLTAKKTREPEDNVMERLANLELAVATLQEQQRESERREVRAERVRGQIFTKLNTVGEGVAEIKGALGLARGD